MTAPRRTNLLTDIALSMDGQLRGLFRKYTRDRATIQEWIQTVHERTFDAPIKDPKKAAAYIYEVANNVAIDWQRREQSAPVDFRSDAELPQVTNLLCPERQVIGLELLERVIAFFPPRCRQALGLVKFEGYSYKEAAVVMRVAEQTVQAHVRDAFASIREAGIEVEGLSGSSGDSHVFAEPNHAAEKLISASDAIELANACRGVVRAYCERYTKDRHEIEAMVHETYRRLVAASTSPSGLRSVPEFLLETARDLALRRLRNLAVIPIDAVADIERLHTLGVDQEIEVIARTDRNMAALSAALKKLPRRCREVFLLYKMDHCTKEEVAKRLRMSESEVTERLAEAVGHFERALSKANEADGKSL